MYSGPKQLRLSFSIDHVFWAQQLRQSFSIAHVFWAEQLRSPTNSVSQPIALLHKVILAGALSKFHSQSVYKMKDVWYTPMADTTLSFQCFILIFTLYISCARCWAPSSIFYICLVYFYFALPLTYTFLLLDKQLYPKQLHLIESTKYSPPQ